MRVFLSSLSPTPLNGDNTPDLTAVKEATALVARHLSRGSIVVYESTVYPGVTEDICRPILERESGFACGLILRLAIHRNASIRATASTGFSTLSRLSPEWTGKRWMQWLTSMDPSLKLESIALPPLSRRSRQTGRKFPAGYQYCPRE